MGKATEVKVSTFKIKLVTDASTTAVIHRRDMPLIVDKTEACTEWLIAHGFKLDEIELVGNKPSNWDEKFGINPYLQEQPVLSEEPVCG